MCDEFAGDSRKLESYDLFSYFFIILVLFYLLLIILFVIICNHYFVSFLICLFVLLLGWIGARVRVQCVCVSVR